MAINENQFNEYKTDILKALQASHSASDSVVKMVIRDLSNVQYSADKPTLSPSVVAALLNRIPPQSLPKLLGSKGLEAYNRLTADVQAPSFSPTPTNSPASQPKPSKPAEALNAAQPAAPVPEKSAPAPGKTKTSSVEDAKAALQRAYNDLNRTNIERQLKDQNKLDKLNTRPLTFLNEPEKGYQWMRGALVVLKDDSPQAQAFNKAYDEWISLATHQGHLPPTLDQGKVNTKNPPLFQRRNLNVPTDLRISGVSSSPLRNTLVKALSVPGGIK